MGKKNNWKSETPKNKQTPHLQTQQTNDQIIHVINFLLSVKVVVFFFFPNLSLGMVEESFPTGFLQRRASRLDPL